MANKICSGGNIHFSMLLSTEYENHWMTVNVTNTVHREQIILNSEIK